MVPLLPTIIFRSIFISFNVLGVLIICSSERVLGNQAPSFVNLSSVFFVSEDTPVGSVILNLRATDVDDSALTFSVAPDNQNDPGSDVNRDILGIVQTGPKSANVTLRRGLTINQYRFVFTVKDGVNVPIEYPCIMIVTPSSFRPPVINNLPKTVDIAEDSSVGSKIYQVSASDPSSAVTFVLQEDSDKFSIDIITGVASVIGKLDYHSQRTYVLYVVATNKKGLNTTGILTINITNSKNHPPYYLSSSFSASLSENTPQGASVITIVAFDGNTDSNDRISYKLVLGYLNLFAINGTSGLITTLNKVDCSKAPVKTSTACEFQVIVEACEPPMKTLGSTCSTVLLVISVNDLNNHAPTFSMPSYDCYVYRHAPSDTPIGCNQPILVDDGDLSQNAQFSLSLQPAEASNWLAVEQISNSTYVILRVKNNSALAREPSNQISVKVIVMGVSPIEKQYGSATVNINIINNEGNDGYDDDLKFNQEQMIVVLNNVPTTGSLITTVRATSKFTNTDDIVYSLGGPYTNMFSIGEKTGQITLTLPNLLDQTNSVYGISVVARNKSKPQSSALAIIFVQLDLKWSPRTVKMSLDLFFSMLEENSYSFFQPLFVKAYVVGNSSSISPTITYFIIDTNSDFSKNFTINESTGEVKPRMPLDYEALPLSLQGLISFTVGAKITIPEGGSGASSSATITVVLKDMNDNQPKFQSPYNFSSLEPLKKGPIGPVHATDDDATSPNNKIIYSLRPSSSSSSPSSTSLIDNDFAVDPFTGVIYYFGSSTLSSSPSPLAKTQTLAVLATDLGTPSLFAVVTVTISYFLEPQSPSSSPPSSMLSGRMNLATAASSTILDVRGAVSQSGINLTSSNTGRLRCTLSNTWLFDGRGKEIVRQQGLELFTVDTECNQIQLGISLSSNYRNVRFIMSILSVTNQSASNRVTGGTRDVYGLNIASILFFINPYKFPLDYPIFLPREVGMQADVSTLLSERSIIGRLAAVHPLDLDRPISYNISKSSIDLKYVEINNTSGIITFTKGNFDFSVPKNISISVVAATTSYDNIENRNAIVAEDLVKTETNFTVKVLPCTKPSFKRSEIVVGLLARDVRVDLKIIDLKAYTTNWSPLLIYSKTSSIIATVASPTNRDVLVSSIKNILNVSVDGSLICEGMFYDESLQRLEVEVNVTAPNCGEPSSANVTLVFLSHDELTRLVIGRQPDDVAAVYASILQQLAGISMLQVFPYAIYRNANDTDKTDLLMYVYNSSNNKMLPYYQFAKHLASLDQSGVTKFKQENNIIQILPYSGNCSPLSSQETPSCLPLVIALSVICCLFFIFIIISVATYLYFKKRQKAKLKAPVMSYINGVVMDDITNSERHIRDEDKDGSTVTNSSASDSSGPTTSSTKNFIPGKKRPERVDVTAIQRSSSIYDSLKGSENHSTVEFASNVNGSNNIVLPKYYSDYPRISGPRAGGSTEPSKMIVSTGMLSYNSKLSDSAIGSTDNCTNNQEHLVHSVRTVLPREYVSESFAGLPVAGNESGVYESLEKNSQPFQSISYMSLAATAKPESRPSTAHRSVENLYGVVDKTKKNVSTVAPDSCVVLQPGVGLRLIGSGSNHGMSSSSANLTQVKNSPGISPGVRSPPSYEDLDKLARNKAVEVTEINNQNRILLLDRINNDERSFYI